MKLQTIYKQGKTGAVVFCSIETNGAGISLVTGQVGTDKPVTHTTLCEPKNIGRSNATTGEQQAELEARSKWDKKIKSGYVLDESGESDIKLPMKVKNYCDQKDNVIFPCYISPKLNGVNSTARFNGSEISFTSRGGESRPSIDVMDNELKLIMKEFGLDELNGELYKHGKFLEEITSAVSKENELTKELIFCIFDIPTIGENIYSKRLKTLDDIVDFIHEKKLSRIEVIMTDMAENHKMINTFHKEAVKDGFEGIVIRNAKGLYKHNERSSDVFKMKVAMDDEFKVTGFNLDKHGHAVYECETKDNKSFKVKRKGTKENRLADAKIAESNIGKWLTVEFESWSMRLIPLKPVGLNFRNCDDNGDPID